MKVTGRIQQQPRSILQERILNPQMKFELDAYFKHYLLIEKAFVKAYIAMDLITLTEAKNLMVAIDLVTPEKVSSSSQETFSDMAFTIENEIEKELQTSIVHWHVDRSRNDFQACAQMMYARENVIALTDKFHTLAEELLKKSQINASVPMPGYTHYQSAQIVSVGFYLSSVATQVIDTVHRLQNSLAFIQKNCPLGSGAMSGQEKEWNVQGLATDLGFQSFTGHALNGVASRDWILEIANCFNIFGIAISRFFTDVIYWGSSSQGFIDLPDDLVSISSSMPQKKNYTIFERIRGKSSHFTSILMDFSIGQRNTSYSNLVEISKESTKFLPILFDNAHDLLDLLIVVFKSITFNTDKLLEACENDYFGGFSLANHLTTVNHIPYRKAQIIAGEFIVQTIAAQGSPKRLSIELLETICKKYHFTNHLTEDKLHQIFTVEKNLYAKTSPGSTNPVEVLLTSEKLIEQKQELKMKAQQIKQRIKVAQDQLTAFKD